MDDPKTGLSIELKDIHVRALLKILNFVNQQSRTATKPVAKQAGRGRPSKSGPKTLQSLPTQPTIESIDIHNRHLIIDSIINCIQYFEQYFKYNYKFVVHKTDDKITTIYKWLQNYYLKELLDDIDFESIVKEVPQLVTKPEVNVCNNINDMDITDSSVSVNETNNNEDNEQQMVTESVTQQELSPLNTVNTSLEELVSTPDKPSPDDITGQLLNDNLPVLSTPQSPTASNGQSVTNINGNDGAGDDELTAPVVAVDDELKAKMSHDLEVMVLLVVIVLYKVRNLFPKLLDYLDFAWIYLSSFETSLESCLLMENLMELLQNELISQRAATRQRSEVLNNEIMQLNAMIDSLDKQYEEDTKELIFMQNATIIGANSMSANCRQLSKLMNLKAAGQGSGRECKPHPCPECGKMFKNAYKLNRHRYVHKDPSEKPFMCDWPGCGYRSIANNDLNRHRMIHTGEKPYQCDVEGCERKYSRPDKLSHHKRVAHNKDPIDKPFACDWPGCGYRSLANADLLRHQYIHTGERPYKCDHLGCDRAFSRPDKLRNHKDKARHHNIDDLMPLDDDIVGHTTHVLTPDTPTQPDSPTHSSLQTHPTPPSALSIADCVPQVIQWT